MKQLIPVVHQTGSERSPEIAERIGRAVAWTCNLRQTAADGHDIGAPSRELHQGD
jgi:hypothetical protein